MDFLVDDAHRVQLLEFNAGPDLKQTGDRLDYVIADMLRGMVDVVLDGDHFPSLSSGSGSGSGGGSGSGRGSGSRRGGGADAPTALLEAGGPPLGLEQVQRLLDKQASKARAVDKKIAFKCLPACGCNTFNVTTFRLEVCLSNFAFMSNRTVFFGELSQEFGVEAGVNVIGIVQTMLRRDREFILLRRKQLIAVLAIVLSETLALGFQPKMLKASRPTILTGHAKGVNIILTNIAPRLK